MSLTIKPLSAHLTVCKVTDYSLTDLTRPLCFIGKTDEENSLVCETAQVPDNVTEREDGWRAFRIEGVLDFSLVGILARISGALSQEGIGLFAISTFNTDYVLVKEDDFDRALEALEALGYEILR